MAEHIDFSRHLPCRTALVLILWLAMTAGAAAQGMAPQGPGSAPSLRETLPGTGGSHVPIVDGLQRQPGGGGTGGLPDPTAGPAAAAERKIGLPSTAPIVQPRDLTGAPIPGITTAPPPAVPRLGADTGPAPGR